MNVLSTILPTKIKVNDTIYPINYDYMTAINIIIALEDNELTYDEKCYILIENLYKKRVKKSDLAQAVEKGFKFIDLGGNLQKKSSNGRIYSFKKDGNYIFTGINSTHHIDIEANRDIHWWKFMAMFMDMSADCMFGEIVYYRKRKLEGKLTKEEKKKYSQIKDLLELDDVRVQSEARKNFFAQYNKFHKNK